MVEYEVDTYKIDRTRNVKHVILNKLYMTSVPDACVHRDTPQRLSHPFFVFLPKCFTYGPTMTFPNIILLKDFHTIRNV